MQSHNYVLGVSGWKMHSNGTLEVNGKIRAIMVEQVDKPETPFAVQDGQVFLTQGLIDAGKLSSSWTLRTTINSAGQTVLTGLGWPIGCGYTGTPADKAEKAEVKIDCTAGASKVLDQMLGTISETDLSESLKNFNLGDFLSGLKKDVVTSDDADLTDRIKTLEACVAQLNSELGRLVVAVSGLVSANAKQ
ncbi:host specificity protein J [Pseudomonas alliivorans]|nr:host specificity protein J [Pseudomonas alliivorans]